MRKVIFRASALLLACSGCTKNPHVQPNQAVLTRASLIEVSMTKAPRTLGLTGVVAARQTAGISSQVLAPVLEVRAREGKQCAKATCSYNFHLFRCTPL